MDIYLTLRREAARSGEGTKSLNKRVFNWIARFDDIVPILGLVDSLDGKTCELRSQLEVYRAQLQAHQVESETRTKELTEELSKLQTQLEAERAAHESLLQKADDRTKELTDQLTKLQAQLEAERAAHESLLQKADDRTKELTDQLTKLQAQLEAERAAHESLLQKADDRTKELTDQLTKLQAQLEAERAAYESLVRNAERRSQELAGQVRTLEDQLQHSLKLQIDTTSYWEAKVKNLLARNEQLRQSLKHQQSHAKARRKINEKRLRDLTLRLAHMEATLEAQQQRASQELQEAKSRLYQADLEVARLRDLLANAEAERAALIGQAERQYREMAARIHELEEDLAHERREKEQSLEELQAKISTAESRATDLTSQLQHHRDLLDRAMHDLAEERALRASLQQELNLFATSTCWRLTKPLRIFGDWLKALRQPRSAEALDLRLLRKSGYFKAKWYLQQNPDVAEAKVDPAFHYYYQGAFEGRDPSPRFSSAWYLSAYPEVASNKLNPLVHYLRIGKRMGFRPRPDAKPSLLAVCSSLLWVAKHQRADLRLLLRKAMRHFRIHGPNGLFDAVAQSVLSRRGKSPTFPSSTQTVACLLAEVSEDLGPSKISTNIVPVTHDRSPRDSEEKHGTGMAPSEFEKTPSAESALLFDDEPLNLVPESELPDLSRSDLPVKLIAFYLPQFHPIPENDLWWGKGFTEWRNVVQATPLFPGHHQPNLPGELGFYDLRVPEVQERQVELARKAGIYGFCFYFYWFNGKRLLERPLDQFASNPRISFPFCICWANEPWTRRWDGYQGEVLMPLEHTPETDSAAFDAMIPYFRHQHYIRVEGRPLLLIYRAHFLSNPAAVAESWRKRARDLGLPDPFLVACQTFGFFGNPEELGFDAVCQFPAHAPIGVAELPDLSGYFRGQNPAFEGRVVEYQRVAAYYLEQLKRKTSLFPAVMPSWDNTPRRKTRATIFLGSSPRKYRKWLAEAAQHALVSLPESRRLVFVIAWNEWAESNYLEPDLRLGYANLKATADALLQVASTAPGSWKILFVAHDAQLAGAQLIALEVIRWIREKTNVRVFTLLLGEGPLAEDIAKFSPVLSWGQLQDLTPEQRETRLREFVGGGVDLIVGNTVVAGRIYDDLAFLNAPIITHIHELRRAIDFYAHDVAQKTIDRSSGFIACSHAVRDSLVSAFGVADHKVCTAHSFLTRTKLPDPLVNQEDKRRLRQQLGLPERAILVAGCGRGMAFRKGADLFCELALALGKRLGDSIHFYWVGSFDNYTEEPGFGKWIDYWAKLNARGVERYVTFLGFHPDPLLVLSACDIFALTSREDPFPLVMLEAAACGLPIVYFKDSGGANEFVGEDCGIGVPFGDVPRMAEAVESLASNEELRQSKGLQAARRVKQEYLPDHQIPKLFSFCRKFAGKPPAVSVVVTNFNHGRYLPKRLETILNQSFQDFELILVDDASTDGSAEWLSSFQSMPRVTVKLFKQNSGSPFGRWGEALSIASGELVWIAEADDWCEVGFLKSLVPLFADPSLVFAYCTSYFADEEDRVEGLYTNVPYLSELDREKWLRSYVAEGREEVATALGIRNVVLNISSVLFRRSVVNPAILEQISTMRFAGDWLFLLSLAQKGRVGFLATPLNFHRRHRASVIGRLLEGTGSETERSIFWSEHLRILEFVITHFSPPRATLQLIARDLEHLSKAIPPCATLSERVRQIQDVLVADDPTSSTALLYEKLGAAIDLSA
ncbi:MAG: hypothetical protein KatS3mg007_1326 [Thermoanaerobaculum sp.]|nr:MAG: hypothetical protein KatS3mg007_1326 [Thermoanaerobaculum sp.]